MYQKVLDAAATAFAEKGYAGSSIRDIADHLGVRSASLYYYWTSKEAALAAVCETGVTTFIANLTRAASENGSAAEKVHAAIHVQLSPLAETPYADYIRVFLRHRHELPDKERRHIVALSKQYQKLVHDIFAEGVASGEFRSTLNVEYAAFALLGLCNSVISARVWPRSADINSIIDEYARIFLAGVSSHELPDNSRTKR
ncbi:TetR family transcriptional regulator [Bradyrhizobium sp. KB893862 SZCCT0404]|uniref:TetR/AcrR family transcriptional regulator n=1 Tax=Bradyrhizobium sp. KB893862 SZCCT0404 TaxID=2807672 RepID=UPI001BACB9F1|nr:TetR/AcrR family transcriptional regulator [Bradyrhizobium sp. KB893862 SZCCT0404]MBR1177141.1 TetR family transcriptional regulator [Bradyrhizobium sp. KB893862 SZCCT0404]